MRHRNPKDAQPLWGEAVEGRDEGMARVEENAGAAWNRLADQQLERYLRTHGEYHVDAWWDWWEQCGFPMPHDQRAIGPVILRASRKGWMVRTGRSRPSVRSHMSDKPIWRSTLVG